MNAEIQAIHNSLQEVLSGEPWYGKSALNLLNEINPEIVYQKPNGNSHSLIELLYHMITWSEFAQHRLEKDQHMDAEMVEALDWRETNAEIHTWSAGIAQFTSSTNKILHLLESATEQVLEEKVDYREYNFRTLLNGLIQHNIYHLGQIAYAMKYLA